MIEDKVYYIDDVAKLWGIRADALRNRLSRGTFPVLPENRRGSKKGGKEKLYWKPGKLRRFLDGDGK